ncbi:MAG TPA: CinA family protein [Methanomassiliicoccales archaeon]|jgi:PncC family amidohydrolase
MTLEQELGNIARAKGITVSLAESCTGGLASDLVTNVPGSSAYFLGALICYSDRSKIEMLGVKEGTITYQGAVSEQCALEMAVGVRNRFHSDLGVSVTGIAGPGGERPGKPVGLVYFAVDDGENVWTERMLFDGDRARVKRSAADYLIGLIIRALS